MSLLYNYIILNNISFKLLLIHLLIINISHIEYLWYLNTHNQIFPINIEIFIKSSTTNNLYVKPLQDIIHINPFLQESTLLFFRFHNNSNGLLILLTTYSIIPYEMYLYFIKLQCFCFDKIQIKPYQTLDLPILFCISKDYTTSYLSNVVLIYNIFAIQ